MPTSLGLPPAPTSLGLSTRDNKVSKMCRYTGFCIDPVPADDVTNMDTSTKFSDYGSTAHNYEFFESTSSKFSM